MTQSDDEQVQAGDAGGADAAGPSGPGWKTTLFVCLLIALAGGGAIAVIFNTEPVAQRVAATRQTAMLVDVIEAQSGTYRPTVVATGTVRPAREVVLRPRVGGRVVAQAAGFVPGGRVAEGETIVRLGDADYRNALAQRRNELDQARADLRLEEGRSRLAEDEVRLLNEQLTVDNRALALREPQLDSARAGVEIARTAVEQARLELDRTSIEAPFDAHVVSREVNVGSEVAPGDALGHLVGSDTYWIEATVPVSKLRWLTFSDDGAGASVEVRNRGAWPAGVAREGRLLRRIGALDDATRMARVLVAVDDPLALSVGGATRPALMLGAYVETRIEGRPVEDVVRLDRDHVRADDTVWVMSDGQLDIREVGIVLRDSEHAYIREGLSAGERVVIGNLATVRDGADLRLNGGDPTGPDGGDSP